MKKGDDSIVESLHRRSHGLHLTVVTIQKCGGDATVGKISAKEPYLWKN